MENTLKFDFRYKVKFKIYIKVMRLVHIDNKIVSLHRIYYASIHHF
jgi:hypothetical protein